MSRLVDKASFADLVSNRTQGFLPAESRHWSHDVHDAFCLVGNAINFTENGAASGHGRQSTRHKGLLRAFVCICLLMSF